MKQRCVDAVEAAIGRRMNKAEIKNIEQKIIEAKKQLARADREKWLQMSESERLLAAAKQVGINALADVKRKNMIFAQDTLTQNQRIAELTHPQLAASDVIDRMVAHYSDMSGIKSIDTWSRTVANEANGVLYEFYASAKGDLRIFTDKKLMDDVVREIYKEPTGDIKARSIAEKLDFVLDKMLRQRFNRAGGDIGQVGGGYIPTQWSSERVKAAGEAAWLNDAKQNIDRASLVHADGQLYSDLEVEAFIKAAFETIESDGVNKLEPGRQGLSGGSKVTNRHSQSRVLHWKDADAWLFMQDKYGAMPLVNLIEMHVRAMAKDIALVERLGSNPRKAMELLQGHAKIIDKTNGVSAKAMKKKLRRADVMFDALMGKDTVPENQVLNNIGVTYRSINVGSLLGSALLSSIPDVAAMSSLARMHGLSQQKMFGELLAQLNPADKEHRQQAAELGLAVDEMIGSITRWGDDGLTDVYSRSSKIARGASTIAAQTMRLSIMNAWSASTKRGYSKLMMNKYGEATRFKSWDDLHPKDRELMLKTGLDERAWEVMRLAEPVDDGKGNKLMSGYSIRQIPNADLMKFGDPARIKDEIATQFQAHVLDEQGLAVVEAGLREHTKMYGRTTGGDIGGFLLRNLFQFKSFPVAVLMRHVPRMLAQNSFLDKAAYAIQLFTGMTLLGGLAVQLSELALGNDPLTMWDSNDPQKTTEFWLKSVVKGGGLGILGDIVASGTNSSGRTAVESIAGPMVSDINSIAGLTVGNMSQWYRDQDTHASYEAFKFFKNKVPALNLFYIRAAVQRMILNYIQDFLAPGYRQRLQRKAEREHGRTQWWGDDLSDVQMPDFERIVQ